MRRFVGEISIPDCELAMDIIQALEHNKNTNYDIELYEGSGAKYDPCSDSMVRGNRGEVCGYVKLKVFVQEEIPAEQLEMGFK